ncbi:MAG TPA: type 4a pilus biogenesis protein PilO [Candidatus Humimicrobiaceae bacterium]|nr:type 4a pilus biogenesis protein PilO [Candidatus Humimicrobiaceae bacterium]
MNKSVIIIVFISLALIFGAIFVLPKYQELDLLWQRIEREEESLAKRKEYLQDLRNTAEELKNYQDQIAKINSALPAGPDLPALFDFLQKAASQSGLYLKSISHSATQSSSEIEELEETSVSLELSGSYLSLKEFISNYLEVTSRLIETESVSFSSDLEEGPRDFNLTIKVYSYAE